MKVELDETLLNFASNLNLRHYSTVSLRNKSNVSRRVRILPPQSAYFSISELRFPHTHGLLAGAYTRPLFSST
jgi:hypothetical protein